MSLVCDKAWFISVQVEQKLRHITNGPLTCFLVTSASHTRLHCTFWAVFSLRRLTSACVLKTDTPSKAGLWRCMYSWGIFRHARERIHKMAREWNCYDVKSVRIHNHGNAFRNDQMNIQTLTASTCLIRYQEDIYILHFINTFKDAKKVCKYTHIS